MRQVPWVAHHAGGFPAPVVSFLCVCVSCAREALTRPTLGVLLLLMDIRRDPGPEERDLLTWLAEKQIHPVVILTKADKLNKSRRLLAKKKIQRDLDLARAPLVCSVRDRASVDLVRDALVKAVRGVL